MRVSDAIPNASAIVDVSLVDHAGEVIAVCADWWGAVWTWSPSTGEWSARPLSYVHAADPEIARRFPDAENRIGDIAALSLGGRLVVAAGGPEQEPGGWDLETGELLWRTSADGGYLDRVIALDDGFMTSQQYSDEVRWWVPGRPDVLLSEEPSYDLAAARIGSRAVMLASGDGLTVFDATTGEELDRRLPDDVGLNPVGACALGERTAVFGVDGGRLHAWALDSDGGDEELFSSVLVAEGSRDHVAALPVGEGTLVVTAGRKALRWWDLADGTELGHADTSGHDITAMESATVDGRPVLVTSGRDGRLRIWDEGDLGERG